MKQAPLPPEALAFSAPLLQSLHLLTREGSLNQDARRKLKQIQHLIQFLSPWMKKWKEEDRDFSIVDHGAGKSYLGFLIYDLLLKQGERGRVFGIENRAELVEKSANLARELSFTRMEFLSANIADASKLSGKFPGKIELTTALHACDTATDDAIDFGLKYESEAFLLVPCCQAEVARALNAAKNTKPQALGRNDVSRNSTSQNEIAELWRRPHHTREFGSHLTNVLRCMKLEAAGYQVNVTELIGWEHSLKNELILAEKKGPPLSEKREKLEQFLDSLGIESLKERWLSS